MASQPAPGGLLEAPREATGEQFALLDNKGRCREVGGPSHCIGLRRGALKSLIRITGWKPLRRLMLLPYMSRADANANANAKQEPFSDYRKSKHKCIRWDCLYVPE